MRQPTTRQQALLAQGRYAVHTRVRIRQPNGNQVDLRTLEDRNWIDEVSYGDDVDTRVREVTIRLHREVYKLSLAPLMGGSKLNAGAALVDTHYEIFVDTAITPEDGTPKPGDWQNDFHGRIDEVNWEANPLTITARDLAGELQDRFIEDERVYGTRTSLTAQANSGTRTLRTADRITSGSLISIHDEDGNMDVRTVTNVTGSGPYTLTLDTGLSRIFDAGATVDTSEDVELVMQQLLTDNSAGVTLHVPTSPGWKIRPYKQESTSLWDALQELANQIGWDLRYIWTGGSWQLTFFEPDRNPEQVDHVFGPEQYYDVTRLSLNRTGIRNVVRVYYGPGDSQQYVEREDSESINRYGRRWMQLTPGASELIDTKEEAERLADAALADLSAPIAEQEIELPFFPWVELGDFYGFRPNNVHYDSPQELAVVAYRHDLSTGKARTVITVRGRPAARHLTWLEREGRPGVGRGGHTITAPAGLVLTTGLERRDRSAWAFIEATWAPVTEVSVTQYEVQHRPDGANSWSTSVTRSNRLRIGPVAGGTTYAVRVRVVSPSGTSGWSSVAEITTAESPAPEAVTGLAVDFSGPDAVVTWQGPDAPDVLGYDVEVYSGATLRRSSRVSDEAFVYTYAMNNTDGLTASISVTVYTVNTAGLRSIGVSQAAANSVPGRPQGLQLSSSVAQVDVSVDDPSLADLAYVEIETANNEDFTGARLGARSQQVAGVKVFLNGDPTFVRVRFVDLFHQAGPWATGSTAAKLVDYEDLADEAVRSGAIAPKAILTKHIQAEQITTNLLEAFAVTAAKLAAGAVTTEKLSSGTIEITNADRPDAALVFKIEDHEVMRLGNITGKAGVAPGASYGLWADIGDGNGAVLVLDVDGFRAYDRHGERVFDIDTNGDAHFAGTVQAQTLRLPVRPS